MRKFLLIAGACALAGCSGESGRGNEAGAAAPAENGAANAVATSGKTPVPLAEVPAEVLAAATAARPGFTAAEAQAETRDGRV